MKWMHIVLREAGKRPIDIARAEFPALVRHAKETVEKHLANLGIHDKFVVKVKATGRPAYDQNWMGMYRGGTQFRGHGPIFWINPNLPQVVARGHDPNYDRELPMEVFHAILTTIAHEYAHVIEEYARYHPDHVPELSQLIKANFADMEDFTEEFGRWLGGSVSTYGKETFGPIIHAWIKVLTDDEAK